MACVKFGMRRAKIKQRDAKVVASNIDVYFAAVRDTRRRIVFGSKMDRLK